MRIVRRTQGLRALDEDRTFLLLRDSYVFHSIDDVRAQLFLVLLEPLYLILNRALEKISVSLAIAVCQSAQLPFERVVIYVDDPQAIPRGFRAFVCSFSTWSRTQNLYESLLYAGPIPPSRNNSQHIVKNIMAPLHQVAYSWSFQFDSLGAISVVSMVFRGSHTQCLLNAGR